MNPRPDHAGRELLTAQQHRRHNNVGVDSEQRQAEAGGKQTAPSIGAAERIFVRNNDRGLGFHAKAPELGGAVRGRAYHESNPTMVEAARDSSRTAGIRGPDRSKRGIDGADFGNRAHCSASSGQLCVDAQGRSRRGREAEKGRRHPRIWTSPKIAPGLR